MVCYGELFVFIFWALAKEALGRGHKLGPLILLKKAFYNCSTWSTPTFDDFVKGFLPLYLQGPA